MLRFLSFFRKVIRADIVKVFSFTALSTFIRMLTNLVSIKIVAIIIGPSGIALLGQLNNFSSIIMTIASGGINSGITKYVSEFKESEEKISILLSTALRITLACSFLVGLLMIVFNSFLSDTIMLSLDYGYVFIIFGLTIVFYALNMMLISILNGYKEFRKFVYVNITGSVLGLIFTLCLVLTLGLPGALISAVTFQSVMLFISLWMVRNLPWVSLCYFTQKTDKDTVKKYLRYTLMALATASTTPVAQLVLRSFVISDMSVTEAGWWEAMNRISNMYLMIITTSFSIYYLPRLSEITSPAELRIEILKSYKIIVPILFIGLILMYLFRFMVIDILFTDDFLPMENLFIWQLLGDFFKILSWILAFVMIAKSMTKAFVTTEILFSLSYVGFAFLLMKFDGLVGIVQGYLVNYVLYFFTLIFLFKNTLFDQKSIRI